MMMAMVVMMIMIAVIIIMLFKILIKTMIITTMKTIIMALITITTQHTHFSFNDLSPPYKVFPLTPRLITCLKTGGEEPLYEILLPLVAMKRRIVNEFMAPKDEEQVKEKIAHTPRHVCVRIVGESECLESCSFK